MKHLKNFAQLNESENALEQYKVTLNRYCDGDNATGRPEQSDVRKRAFDLLDEIQEKDSDGLNSWINQGSTTELQALLRQTTYKGNGNSKEELRDFNAFALLDTVSGYHKHPEKFDQN